MNKSMVEERFGSRTRLGLLVILVSYLAKLGIAFTIAFGLLAGWDFSWSDFGVVDRWYVLLVLIPFIIGFLMLFSGRREFSQKHERFVKYAFICYLLLLALEFSWIIYCRLFGFASLFMALIYVFSSAALILPLAAKFTMLYHLLERKGQKVLYVAVAIPPVFYVICIILSLSSLWSFLPLWPPGATARFVSFAFYNILYGIPYSIALCLAYKRVASGQLQPRRSTSSGVPYRMTPPSEAIFREPGYES